MSTGWNGFRTSLFESKLGPGYNGLYRTPLVLYSYPDLCAMVSSLFDVDLALADYKCKSYPSHHQIFFTLACA